MHFFAVLLLFPALTIITIGAGCSCWTGLRALSPGNLPCPRGLVISGLGLPAIRRGPRIRTNMIGIADFTVAMTAGILSSEGFAQIWAFDSPNIINLHPLAMFPGLFVPLFLAFHLISISKLRQESRAVLVPG